MGREGRGAPAGVGDGAEKLEPALSAATQHGVSMGTALPSSTGPVAKRAQRVLQLNFARGLRSTPLCGPEPLLHEARIES